MCVNERNSMKPAPNDTLLVTRSQLMEMLTEVVDRLPVFTVFKHGSPEEEDPIPELDRIIRENEGADTVVIDDDEDWDE